MVAFNKLKLVVPSFFMERGIWAKKTTTTTTTKDCTAAAAAQTR